jgi:NAD(P)-dependent dehydrogenase (short-subunit alcohol dehydrogenase family)
MATEPRVVVLTGASSGIGSSLARKLGARGDRLVLAARRERELAEVARSAGNGAIPVTADVTRRADVERLRDRALEAFGRVDAWVNNAGRGIARGVLALTDDDLDQMFALNAKSAIYGAQAIIPHFQARGRGHLVNVSSFLGRVPLVPHRSAYSAAKAALNSLTASLRAELRASHPGIHVSLVMPGVVLTDFARNAVGAPPDAGQPRPQGPIAPQTADEVADAIAGLLDRPVAELYTNPALHAVAQRYYADVEAFEQQGPPGSRA